MKPSESLKRHIDKLKQDIPADLHVYLDMIITQALHGTPPFPVNVDGKFECEEGETQCDVCYQPVDKDCQGLKENQWGGMDDVAFVTKCEFCGTKYGDGERL